MSRLDEIKEKYKDKQPFYSNEFNEIADEIYAAGVTEGRGERDDEVEHLQSMAICAEANSEKVRHFESQLTSTTEAWNNAKQVILRKDEQLAECQQFNRETLASLKTESECVARWVKCNENLQKEIKRLKEHVGLVPLVLSDVEEIIYSNCNCQWGEQKVTAKAICATFGTPKEEYVNLTPLPNLTTNERME